jgi:hypothetical protein
MTDQAVQQIYDFAATLMRAGNKDKVVVAQLVERGLSEEQANIVVKNLKQARSKAYTQAGMRDMAIGAVICIIGIVVTVGTLSAARSNGGGSYVVAWGAILFGAAQFLRGVVNWLKGGR